MLPPEREPTQKLAILINLHCLHLKVFLFFMKNTAGEQKWNRDTKQQCTLKLIIVQWSSNFSLAKNKMIAVRCKKHKNSDWTSWQRLPLFLLCISIETDLVSREMQKGLSQTFAIINLLLSTIQKIITS